MSYYTAVEYRQAAEEIVRKMPVMTNRQFARSLYLVTGLKDEARLGVTTDLLKDGVIIASRNGYVTTAESVELVSDGRPEVSFSGIYRMDQLVPKTFFRECMDLYNIVLDLYPKSKDFEIGRSLYQIAFVDKDKNRIYELLRVPHEKESLYKVRILREAAFTKSRNGELFKDTLRRIAVIDDEATAPMIPYCGFTNICVSDDKAPKGFRIIEKRKDDIWRDC